jgi:hypothetical protein
MNNQSIGVGIIVALGVLGAPALVSAEDVPLANPTAMSIDAGTLGYGVSLWHSFNDAFSINGGYNWLNYNKSFNTSDVDYRGKLKLSNFPLMVNWHPMKGTFRLVAGAIIGENKVDVAGNPAGNFTYEINGVTYTAAQVGNLNGTGKFGNSVAPYLGLGWTTHRRTKGFGFFSDIGVMFSGAPKVTLRASGPISSDATFQSNLAQEVQKLNDEIDVVKVFPVMRLGLMYRF